MNKVCCIPGLNVLYLQTEAVAHVSSSVVAHLHIFSRFQVARWSLRTLETEFLSTLEILQPNKTLKYNQNNYQDLFMSKLEAETWNQKGLINHPFLITTCKTCKCKYPRKWFIKKTKVLFMKAWIQSVFGNEFLSSSRCNEVPIIKTFNRGDI